MVITIILTRLTAKSSRVQYVCVNSRVHGFLPKIRLIRGKKHPLFEPQAKPPAEKPRVTDVSAAKH